MDRQLKRFDLPEPKNEEAKYKKLDEFLKKNCIELLPFQRELLAQMLMQKRIHICYPPNFGRTNVLLMMQYFVNEFKRGENS